MADAFQSHFRDIVLKDVAEDGVIKNLLYWIIDSRTRLQKRVDLFLKEQIDNPDPELLRIAQGVRKLYKRDDDRVVAQIENIVRERMVYQTDQANFGMVEKWALASESWKLRKDDCDGQNALIYVLCRLAGIGADQIYCGLGNVYVGDKLEYHFYLLYFSVEGDEFFGKLTRVDATYYSTAGSSIKSRLPFSRYLQGIGKVRYKAPDYLFNEQGCWRAKA